MSISKIQDSVATCREFMRLNPIRAKNVTVCKKDTLSQRALAAWISNVLDTEVKYLDELRTGAIYCQLLHRLFPKSILLSKVRLVSTLPMEYEINFRLLIAAFMRLRVDHDVPMENLMRGAGNYEFCNWFYHFSLVNDKGRPYNAKEMRQNLPIGMNSIKRELRRSQSVIGYEPMCNPTENKPTSFGNKGLSGSITGIAPRRKGKTFIDDCKHPEVNYCEESKNVELPPVSDSEDESVDKAKLIQKSKISKIQQHSSLGNSCNCKEHPIPKYITTPYIRTSPGLKGNSPEEPVSFKRQELQLLRLRKLYRDANDKLDSIKGILLEHHDDPNYSIVHITAIVFNPESLSAKNSSGDAEFF